MNRQFGRIAAGACMALAVTGCIDLTVGSTFDDLTRDAVLNDPVLVETVIASTGVDFFAATANRGQPHAAMEIMGERITSSTELENLWSVSQEPRIPLLNQPGQSAINVDVWQRLYEANAAVTEMLRNIEQNGIRIIDIGTQNDNTIRATAFAKFIQGGSHGYLAAIFDKAAIINTEVDLSDIPDVPLSNYTEVRDSALKWLNQAAELAENNTFTFPNTNALWFWNQAVTNAYFAEIVHSYIARIMVYTPRTPEERAAVAWGSTTQPGTVLYHLNRGLKSDLGLGGDGSSPSGILSYAYKQLTFNNPASGNGRLGSSTNASRIDLRLLGPADTTVLSDGRTQYETWLEEVRTVDGRNNTPGFNVNTPDQRIGLAEGNGANNSEKPMFFRWTGLPPDGTLTGAGTPIQPIERGAYYRDSPYHSSSLLLSPNETSGGRNSSASLDNIKEIVFRPVEIEFLKAEAYIRTGDVASALPIINKTRHTNGGLPEITSTDPNAPVPGDAACVPKRYDGECGDLWDAFMYEKRLETFGHHGLIAWGDARGWGCLLEGTLTELPVPARQLDLLELPIYTLGGEPGTRGSAPVPSNCPLLFRPTGNG